MKVRVTGQFSTRVRRLCALGAVLALCAAHGERESITAVMGGVQREYAREAIPLSYVLVDSRTRRVGATDVPVYTDIRSFLSAQRAYRVHVPLTIVVRQGANCGNARIAYGFVFTAKGAKDAAAEPVMATIHWSDLPLEPGPNEWTLTSDWVIECDKQLVTAGHGFLVETSNGMIETRDKPGKNDKVVGSVADMLFPFQMSHWPLRSGMAGSWVESEFPSIELRDVRGDEQFQKAYFMVFTDDETTPGVGSMSSDMMGSLVRNALATWVNPYLRATYTNTWSSQPWATNVAAIDDSGLQGAYLAYYLRNNPNDADANDLLLKNLVSRGEQELAGRVYTRSVKAFPQWEEYWFRQYLPCCSNAVERRAELIAFRRDHPDSVFALEQLSASYVAEGEWRLAKKMTQRWLELQPSNVFAHAAMATICKAQGLGNAAQAELSRIIRLVQPVDPAVTGFYGRGTAAYRQFLLADAALNASNIDRGVMLLRTSLAADPAYYPALLENGDHYLRYGVAGSARDSFSGALEVVPSHPRALAGMAALYAASGKTKSIRRYQDQLWTTLRPLIDDQAAYRNWTNVATLAKYVLTGSPGQAEALKRYIQALIKLRLYDEASRLLYEATETARRDQGFTVLWADLCRALGDDLQVIVLQAEPVGWKDRALDAWADVLEAEPDMPRAYLESALIHIERGDIPKAYLALRDLYKLERSPELAVWIGDLCLIKAEERASSNVPDRSDRSFLDEAQDWYRKAVIKQGGTMADSSRALYSPGAYLGLARAAAIKDPLSQEPTGLARECLRHFPASLDARLASILRGVEAGGPPPALWAPFTNAFEFMIPLQWNVQAALSDIAHTRNDKPRLVRSMIISAAAQLQWCNLFYGAFRNKDELASPHRYYTIEKQTDYRVLLKRHTFVIPTEAPLWYATRSRFTRGDLRNGTTRWWRRQEILQDAQKTLYNAGMQQLHLASNACVLSSSWLHGIDLNVRSSPFDAEGAYQDELLRCFYDAGKQRRIDLPSPRVTVETATDSMQGCPLPPLVRNRQIIPPLMRHLYVPPAMACLLPPTERDRIYLVLSNDCWSVVPATTVSWPDDWAGWRPWRADPGREPLLVPDARPIRVTIAPSASTSDGEKTMGSDLSFKREDDRRPTGGRGATRPIAPKSDETRKHWTVRRKPALEWAASGAVPLLRGSGVPQLPSFFSMPLNGSLSNVAVEADWRSVTSTIHWAVVLTPAPMKQSVRTWPDEAVILDCAWASPTSSVLSAYVRTFRHEDGMAVGVPGILLGSSPAPAFSTLWWRVDGTMLTMGVSTNGPLISAPHLLSQFAWQQGVHVGFELLEAPHAATLSLGSLRVSSSQ